MNTEKFDLWCIVELMGHTKIAGRCTEQNIAGTNMLRVDVPKTETAAEFTKFYGASAIYAINPVSEEIARGIAQRLQSKPVQAYELPTLNRLSEQERLDYRYEPDQIAVDPKFFDEIDDDDLPY